LTSKHPAAAAARAGRVPAPRRFVGRMAAFALRALGATWRVTREGRDPLDAEGDPQIGAIWHRDVLITAWLYRDRGFSVAVSRSRDGERIAAALPPLGYREPVRGSSSRGGSAALLGLVRLVRAGTTVSVPMDGPRGPALEPKIGVVSLARLSGVKITPVAFAARPCLRFRSWDRTLLPLPFARTRVRYGSPIAVRAGATEAEEEAVRRQLADAARAQSAALDACCAPR